MNKLSVLGLGILCATAVSVANAQEEQPSLKIYFETGSAAISADQAEVLDQASRLFRDGNPVVMIISGLSDTTGPADLNLQLSTMRAQAVATGLTSRGIPAERLQVVGKGNSELEIATEDNVANDENRIAEITWR